MKLRPYQEFAIECTINHLTFNNTHGIVIAPTGSGKSILIAKIAEYLTKKGKVLILAHRKELLQQNKEKFSDKSQVGIVSAGLKEKDFDKQITIAGVQTLSTDASLPQLKDIDYIICDECHLIPNNQEVGTYWKIINHFGARVIGFTATDYRLQEGQLNWGEEICRIHYQPLIDNGYLSPLVNKVSHLPDLSGVDIKLGDYVVSQLTDVMTEGHLLKKTVEKIIQYSEARKHCLIFCIDKKHISQLKFSLAANRIRAEEITADTPSDEREQIIKDFKSGDIKYLLNCEVFTTGFDFPELDMIVIARPTKSKALHEQILGRLTRIAEGKKDGLVVDLAGNLIEHGGLGAPYKGKSTKQKKQEIGHKVCPKCEELMKISQMQCHSCGYEIIPEVKVIDHLDKEDTISSTVYKPEPEQWHDVNFCSFEEHSNKTNGNKSLRIDYYTNYSRFSEWLVPFHDNDFASGKAWQLLRKFNPFIEGESHEELIEFLDGRCVFPTKILVGKDTKNPKYDRILKKEFPEFKLTEEQQFQKDKELEEELDDEIIW